MKPGRCESYCVDTAVDVVVLVRARDGSKG